VRLTAADGWETEQTFDSGTELAAGLTQRGLEHVMLREHRTVRDFVAIFDAGGGSSEGRLRKPSNLVG
jgi:hypothetical protein